MNLVSGRFYRIVFKTDLSHLLRGAQSPEGRFHHSGQDALYMSLSSEGAKIALRYYQRDDDPPRLLVQMQVTDANLLDLNDKRIRQSLGISRADISVRWQDERKNGVPATPWRVSDAARETGADGIIYPSSTRRDLSHLVLFRWNALGGPEVRKNSVALPCFLGQNYRNSSL